MHCTVCCWRNVLGRKHSCLCTCACAPFSMAPTLLAIQHKLCRTGPTVLYNLIARVLQPPHSSYIWQWGSYINALYVASTNQKLLLVTCGCLSKVALYCPSAVAGCRTREPRRSRTFKGMLGTARAKLSHSCCSAFQHAVAEGTL